MRCCYGVRSVWTEFRLLACKRGGCSSNSSSCVCVRGSEGLNVDGPGDCSLIVVLCELLYCVLVDEMFFSVLDEFPD